MYRIITQSATWRRMPLAWLLVALLGACTQVRPLTIDETGASTRHPDPRVVLMPPDVVLVELSAAGLPLPRADWTREAETEFFNVLHGTVAERGGRLIRYEPPPESVATYVQEHVPAVALHNAIVNTLLTYRYRQGPGPELPTRAEGLDWTLGETVAPIQRDYQADYALFLIYRHAAASAGRALLNAFFMVLFGIPQPTSQAVAFASLVDLHDGRLVWTNLISSVGMDVSKPASLASLGQRLIEDLPL